MKFSLTDNSPVTTASKIHQFGRAIRLAITYVNAYLFSIFGIGSNPEIEIHAFRGERGDYFFGIEPRLRFGHVGISLDNGKTIYGFNPIKPTGMTGEEFIRRLREGAPFPGSLQDDTRLFILAREYKLQIHVVKYKTGKMLFSLVKKQLTLDLDNSPTEHKQYSFPKKDIGGFEQGCFNCATYPVSLGLETPYPSGKLGDYL